MIAPLAAVLIIYLLAQRAGLNPTIPILTAIVLEIGWQLIKQARRPRRKAGERPIKTAYRSTIGKRVT